MNKYLKVFIVCLVVTCALAAIVILVSKVKESESSAPSSEESKADNFNDNDPKISSFTSGNAMGSIDYSSEVPAGWQIYDDSRSNSQIAIPTGLVAEEEKSLEAADGTGGEAAIILTNAEKRDVVSIVGSKISFDKATQDFEAKDTGDDGKVTDNPRRLWSDVTEKNIFQYNGARAARYKLEQRSSVNANKLVLYSYFLELDGGSINYTAKVGDTGIDPLVADEILRYSKFEQALGSNRELPEHGIRRFFGKIGLKAAGEL